LLAEILLSALLLLLYATTLYSCWMLHFAVAVLSVGSIRFPILSTPGGDGQSRTRDILRATCRWPKCDQNAESCNTATNQSRSRKLRLSLWYWIRRKCWRFPVVSGSISASPRKEAEDSNYRTLRWGAFGCHFLDVHDIIAHFPQSDGDEVFIDRCQTTTALTGLSDLGYKLKWCTLCSVR
jgi:hypothetical protein